MALNSSKALSMDPKCLHVNFSIYKRISELVVITCKYINGPIYVHVDYNDPNLYKK